MTWFSGLFLMTDPGYPYKTGRREEVMEYENFYRRTKSKKSYENKKNIRK